MNYDHSWRSVAKSEETNMKDTNEERAICQVCGEPMPEGEEMFNYHGYSGDCPKPPLKNINEEGIREEIRTRLIYAFNSPENPDIERAVESIYSLLSKERQRVFETERQFILNILDGIDLADKETGNEGGGTKAIRLALMSRVPPQSE